MFAGHAVVVSRSGDVNSSCLHRKWDPESLDVVQNAGDASAANAKPDALARQVREYAGDECDEYKSVVSKWHASWCSCQAAVSVRDGNAGCRKPARVTYDEASHISARCKFTGAKYKDYDNEGRPAVTLPSGFAGPGMMRRFGTY